MGRKGNLKAIKTEFQKMPGKKSQKDIPKLDLRKPEDCRTFLGSMKVEGRQVSEFTLESGRQISVNDMSDSEAIQYASEMYFDLYRGEDGGGIVDTDLDLGRH